MTDDTYAYCSNCIEATGVEVKATVNAINAYSIIADKALGRGLHITVYSLCDSCSINEAKVEAFRIGTYPIG